MTRVSSLTCILFMGLASACTSTGEGAKDGFDSPRAAAHCVAHAVAERDTHAMPKCFAPPLRAQVEGELGHAEDIEWEPHLEKLPRLTQATDADFKRSKAPNDSWGERIAELSVLGDTFVATEIDGRWYVVDSGL